MALHVYDVHREAYCEISLAAGSTLKDRASYAIGCSLLPVRDSKGGSVCTYDTRNAAHLSIWPADGVVYQLESAAPKFASRGKDRLCRAVGRFAIGDLPCRVRERASARSLRLFRLGISRSCKTCFGSASRQHWKPRDISRSMPMPWHPCPCCINMSSCRPAKMGLLAVYVLSRERILLRCADSSETLQLYELVLPTGCWSRS